jgi:hypothetical protein
LSFQNDDVTKRWNERAKFEKAPPVGSTATNGQGRRPPSRVRASLILVSLLGITLGAVFLFNWDTWNTRAGDVPKPPEKAAPQFDPASLASRTAADLYDLAGKFARNGDTQHALVVWEEAARRRHGQSARVIGEMYDPGLWGTVPTAMTSPNVEFARKWYGRAVEYGDDLAQSRLDDLAAWEETSGPP